MLVSIAAIYRDKSFFVNDGNQPSAMCQGAAGIARGCALAPYLFDIVMAVASHDSRRMSQREETWDRTVILDFVHADDCSACRPKNNIWKMLLQLLVLMVYGFAGKGLTACAGIR